MFAPLVFSWGCEKYATKEKRREKRRREVKCDKVRSEAQNAKRRLLGFCHVPRLRLCNLQHTAVPSGVRCVRRYSAFEGRNLQRTFLECAAHRTCRRTCLGKCNPDLFVTPSDVAEVGQNKVLRVATARCTSKPVTVWSTRRDEEHGAAVERKKNRNTKRTTGGAQRSALRCVAGALND